MTYELVISLVVLGMLCPLSGAILGICAMRHGYAGKSQHLRNVEWGLIVVMLGAAASSFRLFNSMLQYPQIYRQIDLWTVALRILFLWVPYNYYRHVRAKRGAYS